MNLWAILLPPLAAWRCGSRGQFRLNLLLTLLLWVPGAIHALWLVSEHCPDERAHYVSAALRGRR